jgi:gliding motility-associated lipoprotein GldH
MKSSKLLLGIVFLLTIIVSSVSCKRSPVNVYEKYLKMASCTWDRFDQKIFEIPVDDASENYDITFVMHCTDQFSYKDLPLYIIFTTPSGQERIHEVTIPIRENSKMIGVPQGKIFENRIVLWKDLSIPEKGKCKISIENMIPKIQIEGIDEIGIVVTKSR